MALRGFGTTISVKIGAARNWYMAGGIRRWADNDKIVGSDEHHLCGQQVKYPPKCYEGGDPATCDCPDHGRSVVDYAGE